VHRICDYLAIRPRLLLVPEFTEIQWTIRPKLEAWADVASYDPPGVGAEPPAAEPTRRALINRGLVEIDRLGWDRYFVVGDGWGIPTAVGIADERSDSLAGLVLTHASLSHTTAGERPTVSPDVYAALTQMISQDAPGFVRHAIAQVTGGSVDQELAERMLERLPTNNMLADWKQLTAGEDYAEALLNLDCPMLLVKHDGCLMSTEEGFEDAASAISEAKTASVPDAPPTSAEFAGALQRFCRGSLGSTPGQHEVRK
jgi:pimeloyl-ACP methyl ester carboxylesterase